MIWMNKKEINLFWWCIEQGFPFILFDVETTGLKKTDYIIQISALKFEKINGEYQIVDKLNEYINPPVIMDQSVIDIHHITNEFLAEKPTEEELFPKIYNFFNQNAVIAGYNVAFDNKMLNGMFERQKCEFKPQLIVDCYKMVKNIITKDEAGGKRKLSEIAALYGIADNVEFHSADEDIRVTWEVMLKTLEKYKTTPMIPESAKEHADILSMTKYEKGMYVKRIYMTVKTATFVGELYYDIWNNYWRDTHEDMSAIERINMEQLEQDTLKLLNNNGFKTFSSFKGKWKKEKSA